MPRWWVGKRKKHIQCRMALPYSAELRSADNVAGYGNAYGIEYEGGGEVYPASAGGYRAMQVNAVGVYCSLRNYPRLWSFRPRCSRLPRIRRDRGQAIGPACRAGCLYPVSSHGHRRSIANFLNSTASGQGSGTCPVASAVTFATLSRCLRPPCLPRRRFRRDRGLAICPLSCCGGLEPTVSQPPTANIIGIYLHGWVRQCLRH